jgi:uncharacterized membrane protein YfcA
MLFVRLNYKKHFFLLDLELQHFILMFLASALAGLLSGLCGIGGGVVFVPALLIVFVQMGYGEVAMHMAVGTSFALMIPTGLSSALSHHKKGVFRKDLFLKWLPGIIFGVICGVIMAAYLSGERLKIVFAIAICLLALLMQFDPERLRQGFSKFLGKSNKSKELNNNHTSPSLLTLSSLGWGVGTLASLMGIGGATMTVPAMSLLGVQIRQAIGTASALGVLISLPSAIGFIMIGLDRSMPDNVSSDYMMGYLHVIAFAIMLPVSVICTKLGVFLAHKLSFKNLRKVFSIFMVVIAFRMLWSIYST